VIRLLVPALGLFAAPFLLWLAQRALLARGRPLLEGAPWFWLTVTGLLLVVAGMLGLLVAGPQDGIVHAP
jgi:phosphoglycerol transferase MdoB-like AlkP superfamily enzyme